MKKITNKNVVLLVIALWGVFFVLGFIEGFMGYLPGETLLPSFVDGFISFTGALLIFYALYRLYKSPDPSSIIDE